MPKVKDLPFGKIVWYKDLILGVKGLTLDYKYYLCEASHVRGNPFDYELTPDSIKMENDLEKALAKERALAEEVE